MTIEERIEKIEKNITTELAKQMVINQQLALKIESLIRLLISRSSGQAVEVGVSYGTFNQALEDYQVFLNTIHEIKQLPTLPLKINAALKANETLIFKIYADDLEPLNIINAAGGTSKYIVENLMNLPHSPALIDKLKTFTTVN